MSSRLFHAMTEKYTAITEKFTSLCVYTSPYLAIPEVPTWAHS